MKGSGSSPSAARQSRASQHRGPRCRLSRCAAAISIVRHGAARPRRPEYATWGFAYLNGELTMATAWSRAARLADRTPASRNRYVDFLRAASMLVVTIGHWLAAAPYFDASG